jgi:hypothetical protein
VSAAVFTTSDARSLPVMIGCDRMCQGHHLRISEFSRDPEAEPAKAVESRDLKTFAGTLAHPHSQASGGSDSEGPSKPARKRLFEPDMSGSWGTKSQVRWGTPALLPRSGELIDRQGILRISTGVAFSLARQWSRLRQVSTDREAGDGR